MLGYVLYLVRIWLPFEDAGLLLYFCSKYNILMCMYIIINDMYVYVKWTFHCIYTLYLKIYLTKLWMGLLMTNEWQLVQPGPRLTRGIRNLCDSMTLWCIHVGQFNVSMSVQINQLQDYVLSYTCSTVWFYKWIQVWFDNQTNINWGPNGSRTLMSNNI